MKYCIYCGKELKDEAAFCTKCGKKCLEMNTNGSPNPNSAVTNDPKTNVQPSSPAPARMSVPVMQSASGTVPSQPAAKGKGLPKGVLIGGAALVVIAALGLGILMRKGKKDPDTPTIPETTQAAAISEAVSSRGNTAENKTQEIKETAEKKDEAETISITEAPTEIKAPETEAPAEVPEEMNFQYVCNMSTESNTCWFDDRFLGLRNVMYNDKNLSFDLAKTDGTVHYDSTEYLGLHTNKMGTNYSDDARVYYIKGNPYELWVDVFEPDGIIRFDVGGGGGVAYFSNGTNNALVESLIKEWSGQENKKTTIQYYRYNDPESIMYITYDGENSVIDFYLKETGTAYSFTCPGQFANGDGYGNIDGTAVTDAGSSWQTTAYFNVYRGKIDVSLNENYKWVLYAAEPPVGSFFTCASFKPQDVVDCGDHYEVSATVWEGDLQSNLPDDAYVTRTIQISKSCVVTRSVYTDNGFIEEVVGDTGWWLANDTDYGEYMRTLCGIEFDTQGVIVKFNDGYGF